MRASPSRGCVCTGLVCKADSDLLAAVELAKQVDELCVIVTNQPAHSDRWRDGIGFFSTSEELENLRFPDWETLPYDTFSPHQDITSERLATLQTLRSATHGVLTVPVSTLMQKVPPLTYLDGACFQLACGDTFDVAKQRLLLESAGYQSVETVTERGQYAVRGALMDVYPMGAPLPVRIDLLDDEIDTLRTFDPDSQRTVDRIERLSLLPAKEFPFDDAASLVFAIAGTTSFRSMFASAVFIKMSAATSHRMGLNTTCHCSSTSWQHCLITCRKTPFF